MTIEILFRAIREECKIKGLQHKGYHYKLRAFSDDDGFYCRRFDQIDTLSHKENNNFDVVAGFYLNKAKSKILCKNMTPKRIHELASVIECEIVKKKKYLGVEVTNKNLELFNINYEKLWSS